MVSINLADTPAPAPASQSHISSRVLLCMVCNPQYAQTMECLVTRTEFEERKKKKKKTEYNKAELNFCRDRFYEYLNNWRSQTASKSINTGSLIGGIGGPKWCRCRYHGPVERGLSIFDIRCSLRPRYARIEF